MPIINDPDGLSQGGETAVADLAFTSSAGANTTITGAATLPAVTAGDYLEIRDHSTAGNNGLYEVTGSPTTSSIDLTKQALTGSVVNPTDAVAEAARTLGTNANEKNVHFDTTNLRITFLNGFGSTTVLDNAGVVWQSFYSFCKEEWKFDNDLIKFPFPLVAITPEQFEFVAGWKPVDEVESTISTTDASDTRRLLRTGGWDEVDSNGFVEAQYFGWATLGNIDSGDNAYYFFDSESSATSAVFDGPVNESVQSIIGIGNPDTCTFATSSTITRATGSFITDGFLINDRVFVQNATNSANDGSFVITAVAATTLTVTGTPFATGADAQALLAIDRRQNVFTTRIRVFGKTYDQSTSTAIGVTTLTNQVYRFPLSESTDNVVVDLANSETGGVIATLLSNITGGATAPYDDMAIGYFATPQTRSGFNALGGDTPSPGDTQFGVVIEGDSGGAAGGPGSAEQIYAFVQAQLQLTTNINDPDSLITGEAAITINGQIAEPLLALASTGNTLSSLEQTSNPGGDGTGVVVDNFDANDTNRVAFVDNDGDTRSFPFVASGTLQFNSNLSTDIDAIYRMFFTNDDAGDNSGRDFGTIDAITVQDNSPADIEGAVPQQGGGSSVAFTFDYDGNVQRGGASAGTDAPITIVAIGLSTAQYVVATGTITRATGLTFSLVAALERNYGNP